jgi:hypothetical protein
MFEDGLALVGWAELEKADVLLGPAGVPAGPVEDLASLGKLLVPVAWQR